MIGNSPYINTKQGLKDYILRSLGEPVINVELHDSQIEDIISTTMAEFIPYSDDGVEKRFKIIELECGKKEYDMDYSVYSVLALHHSNYLDYSPSPSDLFSLNQTMANQLQYGGLGQMDILSLELVQEQISTLEVVFGKRIEFNYNSIAKKLYLHADPRTFMIRGTNDDPPKYYCFMEYYKCIDWENTDEETNNLYDNKWVQQYAIALCRMQWGFNLMKYEGSTLPNGMTINAQSTLEQGKADAEALMEQLREEWSSPIDFFIG